MASGRVPIPSAERFLHARIGAYPEDGTRSHPVGPVRGDRPDGSPAALARRPADGSTAARATANADPPDHLARPKPQARPLLAARCRTAVVPS